MEPRVRLTGEADFDVKYLDEALRRHAVIYRIVGSYPPRQRGRVSDWVQAALSPSKEKQRIIMMGRELLIVILGLRRWSSVFAEVIQFHGFDTNQLSRYSTWSYALWYRVDAAGIVKLWDIRKISEFSTIDTGPSATNKCVFDESGSILAIASSDNTIKCFQVDETILPITELLGHEDAVQAIVFDPACKFVVSGSTDCTFRVWA
ncbi:hypothetical protein L7F22_023957 [Adiantum nelumboides]|nr:hypothetical protein [Adiantum nelumboides]